MTLSLVVQAINTVGFSPVKTALDILIDGKKYPYIIKDGGYYVFTSELPQSFVLTVDSAEFFPFSQFTENLPKDKIVPVQLIPRYPPGKDLSWLTIENPKREFFVVLGFDYFKLKSIEKSGITLKNPTRINLEGRSFLLSDTGGGNKEFLTFGGARDIYFESYDAQVQARDYNTAASALLPAFKVCCVDAEQMRIPLDVPAGKEHPVWIYESSAQSPLRLSVARGQEVIVRGL